jgi:hypothetical protein
MNYKKKTSELYQIRNEIAEIMRPNIKAQIAAELGIYIDTTKEELDYWMIYVRLAQKQRK